MSYTKIVVREEEVDVSVWKNRDPRQISIYLTNDIRLEFPFSKIGELLEKLTPLKGEKETGG